jgi:ribosomal protein S27E
MNSAKKPTARLEWSLYVDCPKCGDSNDIADPNHDTEHGIAQAIFTNDWDKLQKLEVTCEHCRHEFQIDRVEY